MTRKSPDYSSRQQRSDAIRPRVLDVISLMGFGSDEYGVLQFVRRMERIAQLRGMRFFSGATSDPVKVGVSSMGNLLKLKSGSTGRSEKWVLDLVEATITDYYHHEHPIPSPVDPATEQLDEMAAAVNEAVPSARPLSLRVLDAFMDRDSEKMLELTLEIERMESSWQS